MVDLFFRSTVGTAVQELGIRVPVRSAGARYPGGWRLSYSRSEYLMNVDLENCLTKFHLAGKFDL